MSALQEGWALPGGGWQRGVAGEELVQRRTGKDLGYLTEGSVPWTVGREHRDNEKMSPQEVWGGRCAQEFQPYLWMCPRWGVQRALLTGRWGDQQGCFPGFWPKGWAIRVDGGELQGGGWKI